MSSDLLHIGDRVAFNLANGATELGTIFRFTAKARSSTVSIKTDDGKTYVRDVTRVRLTAGTHGEPDYSVNHVS
jgi:hypothetical protein